MLVGRHRPTRLLRGLLVVVLLSGCASTAQKSAPPAENTSATTRTSALSTPAPIKTLPPKIKLLGLKDEPLANVSTYLALVDGRAPKRSAAELGRWEAQAEANIRNALSALGYYGPEIVRSETGRGAERTITYNIRIGDPVRVTALNIHIGGEAQHDAAFKKLLAKAPLKIKDKLHHGRYSDLLERLDELAQERGYFDAKFTRHRIDVDRAEFSAVITIDYQTGRRYRFGDVAFGATRLKPEKLRELLPFKADEPFERSKLERLQRRLEATNYFDWVLLDANAEDAKEHRIPVKVELKERKRWLYEFGAGLATDTGPRLLLGVENRMANDDGHRYGMRLAPSQSRSEANAFYSVPLDQLRGDELRFESNYLHTDDDLGISDVTSVRAERSLRLGDYGPLAQNLRFSYYLALQDERYALVGETARSSFLLMPGAKLSARQSNDALYPTAGYRWNAEARGAEQSLGSDLRFLQGRLDGKWLTQLFNKQRLILRANLGYTAIEGPDPLPVSCAETPPRGDCRAQSDFDNFPTSLRFTAGGDQSVRGYDYTSLGPTNRLGLNIGGKHLLAFSAEYDVKLSDNWLLASFVDSGNAFNDLNEYELKTGVGLGVRWLSPVGPIRLDLAHPLDDPDESFRIHFSMGPEL